MRFPVAVSFVSLSFPVIAAPVQFSYTGEIVFVSGDPLVQTAALAIGMSATLQFVFDEAGQSPDTWGEADLQMIRLTADTLDLRLQAPWGGDGLYDFSGAFSVDQSGQVTQALAIAMDNQPGADVSGAMLSSWTIGTFTFPLTPFPGGPVQDLSAVGFEFVYADSSRANLLLNNFGAGPYWAASSVPEVNSVCQFGMGLVAIGAFAAFRRQRSIDADRRAP